MRKYLISILLLILFLSLLCFREESFLGASEGLLLWYHTVLPTLLPFMILSNLMMHTNTISLLTKITDPIMKHFPGVSKAGSFAVTTGFLCGYPMGAKVTADLIKNRQICITEGAYLLSFCNNTSPAFILNILLLHAVPDTSLHLPLFLILFLSPLLSGQLFRLYYIPKKRNLTGKTQSNFLPFESQQESASTSLIDSCLTDSFQAIIKVGLYMMLFGILIRLFLQFPCHSQILKEFLTSSLEITYGISIIKRMNILPEIKYIALMALASFGGFCAVFQTASMIQGTNLSLRNYVIEKLITSLVTSLFTALYLFGFR